VKFGGGYYTQLGLGSAVVVVEELVGEVVWSPEEEVGVEGAEFPKIDSTALTSVTCLTVQRM
jgi:hypothetical protein